MPKTLPNIRDEILHITREMMAKEGYSRICIRDIAKKCNIATGTFYNYFGSKQEIIASLLESDWAKLIGKAGNEAEGCNEPIEKLLNIFTALRETVRNVHMLWAEGVPEHTDHHAMGRMQSVKKRLHNELSVLVARAIEEKVPDEKRAMIADMVTRMFFSYSYDEDICIDTLRYGLEKLLS